MVSLVNKKMRCSEHHMEYVAWLMTPIPHTKTTTFLTRAALRTGHNRLNHHMATKLKLVPSPLCSCGKNQTAEHILQACPYHSALRDTIWLEETALQKKLYGPREDLERTARFALQSGLTI
ncbi:hypothetical protein V1264_000409 [Littorina saxatilis]|uniref:Reverse transcriptase zinc-binding domain-containing protein n=1 Tax=Littorina saxatilis TaxID=31220 RepID=A0AAN9GMQ7_9CAEN